MNDPQDRFAGEPAPGTRDTGSDKPSGGEDRPSGAYKGDESVPTYGEADPGFATEMTSEPPRDVDPAVPPYEGRKAEADETGTETGDTRTGGATGPTADPGFKAPSPGETVGGSTASPAEDQPASGGSETDTDDDAVGPAHTAGTGRGEEKR